MGKGGGKGTAFTAFTLALLQGELLGWEGLGSEQDERNRSATLAEVLPCASQDSAQAQGLLFPPAKSNLSRALPLTPQRFASVPLCPQHSTCSSHPAENATKLQFFRTTVLAQEPQMSTLHWTGIYLSHAAGGSCWRQPLQATFSRERGCVS